MADSHIEWTDKSWNPTTGCSHYSYSEKNGGNECWNCYAETLTKRLKAMGQERYKMGFNVVVEHDDVLNEPYTWKKPTTVFVNSMSDMFHRDISDDFIRKVFKVMNDTPQHKYQILTKRHTRFEKLPDDLIWSDNIWMGVSCGNQYATRRISALVQSKAKHKFLSIEPFIQEISEIDLTGIEWVIVGAESGNNYYKREKDENGEDKYEIIGKKVIYSHELDANGKKIIEKVIRPMKKEWVEIIRNKCEEQNVAFFFKQWGKLKNNPNPNDPSLNKAHRYYAKGGCQLDGKFYLKNPTVDNDSVPVIGLFEENYFVMDEYEGLNTIWELKSYLPMMDSILYGQLKDNIKKNGLNDPILYIVTPNGEKLVIEGHTRLNACLELKKTNIPTKEVKNDFKSLDDIKFWMVKHQFQRRNLSSIEKIQLAYLSKDSIEKIAKDNLSKGGKNIKVNEAVDTNAEIAKIAGVGRTSVVNYNTVLKRASKSVIEKLNNGQISISTAHDLVRNLPDRALAKVKVEKKQIKTTVFESIEEGTKQIKEGVIEGLIILKDASQIDLLNDNQKSKFGFYLIK
jgi:protein gp37